MTEPVFVSTKTTQAFEFDPDKDAANIAKHGLSLAFGARIFLDEAYLLLSAARPQDGEERRKVIGLVEDRLFTAVHVERDGKVRFISVRRSNDGEEKLYRRP